MVLLEGLCSPFEFRGPYDRVFTMPLETPGLLPRTT